MPSNLLIHRDPFRIHVDVEEKEIAHGLTIFETVIGSGLAVSTETGIQRIGTYVVLHNGVPILFKDWGLVLQDNDVVQIAYLPKGGGGGGSNIKSIIGAVLIAVAAYFTFGLSLVATAAVGIGAFAVLSLAGSTVPQPSTSMGKTSSSTSPTYSLNAQGNNARLLEAIPRVYGRMRTFPDLASQPYSEYEGNEQYLYQLFCISLGSIEIERIDVDETNINSFEDAEIQIINPGQAVTLFPDNVVTSDAVSNLDMLGPNNPTYSTLGPFVSSGPGSKANYIGVDIAFPRGIGRVDDTGNTVESSLTVHFDYQEVDDSGQAIGPWNVLFEKVYTFATQDPQLVSVKTEVLPARYQVRGYRMTPESDDNRSFDAAQWIGLKSYLQSTHVYGDVTLLATKMRATNALNSSTARKLSVISKGLVQKWDPVNGWGALEFSANPAWVGADILRNTEYGRGLGTDRMVINTLYRLSAVWDQRGDMFNGVFDTTSQLWEALSQVFRVGRAVPIYYAGVIDVIRDEPQTAVKSLFQPANMVLGSFSTTYSYYDTDTPDHVIVEYIDSVTWKPATVVCKLPGETANNPYNVKLFGCTDRDQGFREGISMAAANRDRRRSISFTALSDGFIPRFNSLSRISHDVPQWGYSGRVISLNRINGKLSTSEPIPFNDQVTYYIAFRKRNGSEDGPYVMVKDNSLDEESGQFGCIVSASAEQLANIYISDGTREDLTYYQCGPTEREGLKVLITSALPDGKGKVNIVAINYADSVHSAENGGVVPPPAPASELPGIPSAPIVNSVTVVYTVEIGIQNIIATPALGAIYYEFAAKSAAGDWAVLGTNQSPTLQVYLSPGEWSVRVRGVGRAVGPWATWNGTIEATSLPTPRLDSFTATTKLFTIGLNWSYQAETNTIAERIEVWASQGDVLGNASRLVDLPYPANAFDHVIGRAGEIWYYWARVIDKAKRVGPWFNLAGTIGQTSNDADPILDMIEGRIEEEHLGQLLQEKIELIAVLQAQVNALDGLKGYENKPYTKGQMVVENGIIYLATQAVPTNTPPPNTTYWKNVGELLETSNALAGQISTIQSQITEINGSVVAQAAANQSLKAAVRDSDNYNGLADALAGYNAMASAVNESQVRASESEASARTIIQLTASINGNTGQVTSLRETVATNQSVTSQALEQVSSRVSNNEGQITSLSKVVVDNQTATSTSLQQVSARVGTAEGKIETQSTVVADINGKVSTTWTMRLQQTSNNAYKFLGIGGGIANGADGLLQASFYIAADKFAFINDTTNGIEVPFALEGGQTFIKEAFIKKATIQNLLVGATLGSTARIGSGPNQNKQVMIQDFNVGQTTYNGLSLTRVDNSAGTKITDVNSGIAVIEWGEV